MALVIEIDFSYYAPQNNSRWLFFSLVEPRLPPDTTDSIFWGVTFRDFCDNIIFNPFLDLKFSFVVYTMESVEFSVRDVLDILSWPTYYLNFSTKNSNTEFP